MGKVLIVDDQESVRESIARLLQAEGHEVRRAADGEAGLETWREFRPDLTLLDRQLPKLSGSEVLERIRQEDRDARVLVLTGFPDFHAERKYLALGAIGFLSKALDLPVLVKLVNHRLRSTKVAPPPKNGQSVLIVDDEEAVRAPLKRFLEGKGLKVYEATCADAGKKLFSEIRPTLSLLDLSLPDGSGLDLLKAFREKDPEAAVMMITGGCDEDTARKCMEAGAFDFVMKPFDFEYLDTSLTSKLMILC